MIPQLWGFAVGTSNLGKGKDSVKSSAVLGKEMLYFSLCSGILSAVLKSLIDCVLCCRTGKVGIF